MMMAAPTRLVMAPYHSTGVSPAYLVHGLFAGGGVAFAKRADAVSIRCEVRAAHLARRLGIGHLIVPVAGWRHPQSGQTYLISPFLADAVTLKQHPYGAARLRALAEWEKVALLRWQDATGDNDRHAENYLILPGGRVLAIDYERAFRTADALPPGSWRPPTQWGEGVPRYDQPHRNAVWHWAWRGGEREARWRRLRWQRAADSR